MQPADPQPIGVAMTPDRYSRRFYRRPSPLTVALLVVIGAVCAVGGAALVGLFVRLAS